MPKEVRRLDQVKRGDRFCTCDVCGGRNDEFEHVCVTITNDNDETDFQVLHLCPEHTREEATRIVQAMEEEV